ncbi:HIT domain protein [compost metagenome]
MRASGYGTEGINIVVNDGPAANQHVPHLHLHLIPRRRRDLPGLLGRALVRFLPFGRKALQVRLTREADLLRNALQREL